MIAALYIDPRGPYAALPGVDCWDRARDARLYPGPWPVVAHPPCGPWANLRQLYRGDEHDCAVRAVAQVRAWGGVLEHPRGSTLWSHCNLPRPNSVMDAYGYSIVVDQCAWGHVARKRTWLYLVGIPVSAVLSTVRHGGKPTHWVSGRHQRGIKICSRQQRSRTPPAFAEWLVWLAGQVVR